MDDGCRPRLAHCGWVRPFKVLAIAGAAAVIVAAALVVVPETWPTLAAGLRERPESPALVTACWLLATSASIAGKRALAGGALSWRGTAVAHVFGTVSNRIVPAGAGAGGTYFIALRRGGMTLTAAAAMVALWAVASGVVHGSGAVVGVVWLNSGVVGVAALASVVAVVGWRARAHRAAKREAENAPSFSPAALVHSPNSPDTRVTVDVATSTDIEPRRLRTAADPGPTPATRRGRVLRKLSALRRSVADAVATVRANPRRAVAAIVAQAGAMSCLAVGFAIATSSFGVPVSMTTAIAAYLGGTALSATIPTPAGIGAADAALVGALVMVGSPLSDAVPAVLVFRAVILLAPIAVAIVMAIGWTSRLWPHRYGAPVVSQG